MLVVLFLAAQFAGVVSSPLASADALAKAASHAPRQHVHFRDFPSDADHQGDHGGDQVDHCCALHAFFAGVLPSVIAIETAPLTGQRLVADLGEGSVGVALGRLDRPPKTSV